MKVEKERSNIKEPTVALKDTKPGDVYRFQHDSFEDALKADLFWMRIEAPEAKDRIRLVNIHDGKVIERDGDHRVISIQAKMCVS